MAAMVALHAIFSFLSIVSHPLESSAATRTKTVGAGFGTRLFHCNSPHSPFYNPNLTAYDREVQAAQRSISRLHYFDTVMSSAVSPDAIQSPVFPGRGDYIMKVSLGTPPFEFFGDADTGSSVTWTQCLPCQECFKQDIPIFDPSKSSTYSSIACDDHLCRSLPRFACKNTCQYQSSYRDNSRTDGDFVKETFTFDTTDGAPDITVPNIAFGCGHNNSGLYRSYETGSIGLGGGSLSLVSQLGSLSQDRFSYCLAPSNDNTSSSELVFGERAVLSGGATPIISVAGRETFYFLNLDDISVGSTRLNLPPDVFHLRPNGERGLIIDSGTTLTFLHIDGFTPLKAALKKVIKLEPATSPFSNYELCYKGSGNNLQEVPDLTFHFDGVDVRLNSMNTFKEVIPRVLCLTMASTTSLSIFGNLAQQNYNVGYALGSKVTFAPADCASR